MPFVRAICHFLVVVETQKIEKIVQSQT
jgi:hypothetical protein